MTTVSFTDSSSVFKSYNPSGWGKETHFNDFSITRIRTGSADDGLNRISIADCIAQRLDEHCNNRFSLEIIRSRPGGDEVDARNESGLGAAVSDSLAGFIKCHQRGRVFSILNS